MDMSFTFLVLFAAHVAGDFVFQTKWMVDHKAQAKGLMCHGAIVGVLTALALGGTHWAVWAGIVVSHTAIDWVKARFIGNNFWAFTLDQALHIAVLAAAALMITSPLIWAQYHAAITAPLIVITGLVVASQAGGPLVQFVVQSLSHTPEKTGILGAGRMIGLLERGLIYGLILVGEPAGVGFLITAKSIIRFRDAKSASEYILIGTLASFAWAFAVAYATGFALDTLAPPPLDA